MQAIINGEMYEVEPAVKVILDRVMCENAELKRENKRLEEGYQKSLGVIAADSLPTKVDMYKIKQMCIELHGCRECEFFRENVEGFDRCVFEGLPMNWNFGGADNETD